MFTLKYKTILIFLFIYFIYTTNAICPSNYIKNENNCISSEKGFSKLKIIYCNFMNSTSHKHSIISIIKNPYDNFSTISYPKYENGSTTFIDQLPNYSETDDETCIKKVPLLKFQSIFKTQIIDLYKTQKKYLCDENYKYEFFYLEGVSPCQYTSYDYYYAPILSLNTFICPETETDDFTNKLVVGSNNQCPLNAIYSQTIELGSKISFPDTCSIICSHGNCVDGKCECFSNWSGSTCNVKTCSDNTDCMEISKNNVCTNSTCQCKHGFIETNGICVDENECITKKPCNLNTSICINTDESFKCECKDGYKKYSTDNSTTTITTMDSIDQCLHISSKVNEGTYICNDKLSTCQCKSGFTFSNSDCLDIDECSLKTADCPKNSVCNNLIGTYKCKCLNGHILFNGTCIPFPNIQNIKSDSLVKGLITMLIDSDINYSNIFKGFYITNGGENISQCKNITYIYNSTNSIVSCNLDIGLNYNGYSFSTVLIDDTVKELKNHLSIPFIKSIEKPITAGGIVKMVVNYFNNFTVSDKIEIKVNGLPVDIKSIKKNTISISIDRGSGKNIPLSLIVNEEISTDYQLFQYQEPYIENYTTISIETGGYITINGNNFGNDQKNIQVFLRDKQDKVSIECTDLTLISVDKILKCYMPSLSNISNIINNTNNNNNNNNINDDTQKLIWVKVNNLYSKDWIYFYYNQADTSYNCNSSTTCSNHGTCLYGQCICNQGWSGPNCDVPVLLISDENGDGLNDPVPILEDFNSKVPLQKIKTKNGTIFLFGIKSLIEYSPDGEIVEQVELEIQADWLVGETINDPEIGMIKNYSTILFNYAEINLTFVEPLTNHRIDSSKFNSNYLPLEYGTVRLLININKWPFQSRTNYLDIIMESSTIIKDKLRPQCRTTSFTKYSQSPWIQTFSNDNITTTSNNNTTTHLNNTIPISTVMSNVIKNNFEKEEDTTEIIWYLTTNDYVSLYVQFINKIKIDNNIRTIKILKKTLFNNPGNNSVDVILRIPYFNQSVFVNPTDFKIITNEKPYINEQLTCIVEKPIDSNSQHSSKLIISSVCFIIGILALFTSVSALWYIIRKRRLSKSSANGGSGGGNDGGGGGGGGGPKDLEKSNQIINNGASQPTTTTAIESSNSLSPIST